MKDEFKRSLKLVYGCSCRRCRPYGDEKPEYHQLARAKLKAETQREIRETE